MSSPRLLRTALLAAAALAVPLLHCSGKSSGDSGAPSTPDGDAGLGADGAPAGLVDQDRPLVPASKVDVLFAVDNSSSMGAKSTALASSVGTLLRDLARVGDVHVGVVTSSLGNFGGDVCDPANPATNGHAHLQTTGPTGAPVPGVTNGVLAFSSSAGNVDDFVSSAADLVRGVGQAGCGLEAQLETMYHFLVQPDPWVDVKLDANNLADLGTAVDGDILAQRKAFLRPDSALVIAMLTDEDDSSADPLSVGGQGWAYMAKEFPGSKVFRGNPKQGTTAPRGTSVCDTNPASPDCTSCGFQSICDPQKPECQKIRNDPNCRASGAPGQTGDGYDGYFAAADDELNVRFQRMKQRFGVDPQYPISRYVDGLSSSVVANRASEHVVHADGGPRTIDPYTGTPACTNPIFAAALPGSASEELCNLARGPRSRELVVFALLGGVPPPLATATPDWGKIVGANPDAYDQTGIDPHMIQSVSPRPGLTGADLPLGNNGTDPINGREWMTNQTDLEYACTFALPAPAPCAVNETSCDCSPDNPANPPLCSGPGTQTRGKAYPTLRELRVVRGLGERGVVGTICATSYDDAMKAISARLSTRLKP
jgi:hypothetical protein